MAGGILLSLVLWFLSRSLRSGFGYRQLTLTDGVTGAILTTIPHPVAQNIKDIEATETKVKWIVAGTPPGLDLLDPEQIASALRTGYDRAKIEAGKIREFWA